MRYINLDGKNPPPEWVKRANELNQRLLEEELEENRKKIIDDNCKLWGNLKPWLLKLSYYKCWYSESNNDCSALDVDHFRPKKQAKELDESSRQGYWWLAFDWRNYRLSGEICNRKRKGNDGKSRGKQDYFPIREGTPPASGPDSDINDEINVLLDPTDTCDPLLLTFGSDGLSRPTASKGTFSYFRAQVSIRLYHLDYFLLVEGRKKTWNYCYRLMNEIINLMKDLEDKGSISANAKIKEKICRIKEIINEKAVYSSTARSCLKSSDYPLFQQLVSIY